jgi:hypothetical protein
MNVNRTCFKILNGMDIIESYNEDKFNTIFVRKNLADK